MIRTSVLSCPFYLDLGLIQLPSVRAIRCLQPGIHQDGQHYQVKPDVHLMWATLLIYGFPQGSSETPTSPETKDQDSVWAAL